MPDLYCYRARVRRVVDGDTLDVEIDAGFDMYTHKRLRLLGVNTPEKKGATRDAGIAAMVFTKNWVAVDIGEWPLIVQTHKSDAFGRWLATVYVGSRCLNDDLLAAGQAIPFMGDTHQDSL